MDTTTVTTGLVADALDMLGQERDLKDAEATRRADAARTVRDALREIGLRGMIEALTAGADFGADYLECNQDGFEAEQVAEADLRKLGALLQKAADMVVAMERKEEG